MLSSQVIKQNQLNQSHKESQFLKKSNSFNNNNLISSYSILHSQKACLKPNDTKITDSSSTIYSKSVLAQNKQNKNGFLQSKQLWIPDRADRASAIKKIPKPEKKQKLCSQFMQSIRMQNSIANNSGKVIALPLLSQYEQLGNKNQEGFILNSISFSLNDYNIVMELKEIIRKSLNCSIDTTLSMAYKNKHLLLITVSKENKNCQQQTNQKQSCIIYFAELNDSVVSIKSNGIFKNVNDLFAYLNNQAVSIKNNSNNSSIKNIKKQKIFLEITLEQFKVHILIKGHAGNELIEKNTILTIILKEEINTRLYQAKVVNKKLKTQMNTLAKQYEQNNSTLIRNSQSIEGLKKRINGCKQQLRALSGERQLIDIQNSEFMKKLKQKEEKKKYNMNKLKTMKEVLKSCKNEVDKLQTTVKPREQKNQMIKQKNQCIDEKIVYSYIDKIINEGNNPQINRVFNSITDDKIKKDISQQICKMIKQQIMLQSPTKQKKANKKTHQHISSQSKNQNFSLNQTIQFENCSYKIKFKEQEEDEQLELNSPLILTESTDSLPLRNITMTQSHILQQSIPFMLRIPRMQSQLSQMSFSRQKSLCSSIKEAALRQSSQYQTKMKKNGSVAYPSYTNSERIYKCSSFEVAQPIDEKQQSEFYSSNQKQEINNKKEIHQNAQPTLKRVNLSFKLKQTNNLCHFSIDTFETKSSPIKSCITANTAQSDEESYRLECSDDSDASTFSFAPRITEQENIQNSCTIRKKTDGNFVQLVCEQPIPEKRNKEQQFTYNFKIVKSKNKQIALGLLCQSQLNCSSTIYNQKSLAYNIGENTFNCTQQQNEQLLKQCELQRIKQGLGNNPFLLRLTIFKEKILWSLLHLKNDEIIGSQVVISSTTIPEKWQKEKIFVKIELMDKGDTIQLF